MFRVPYHIWPDVCWEIRHTLRRPFVPLVCWHPFPPFLLPSIRARRKRKYRLENVQGCNPNPWPSLLPFASVIPEFGANEQVKRFRGSHISLGGEEGAFSGGSLSQPWSLSLSLQFFLERSLLSFYLFFYLWELIERPRDDPIVTQLGKMMDDAAAYESGDADILRGPFVGLWNSDS